MEPDARTSRPLHFSLLALMLVVTLLCLWLGYVGPRYRLLWSDRVVSYSFADDERVRSHVPWYLRLIGIEPVDQIILRVPFTREEREAYELAFPEASVERDFNR